MTALSAPYGDAAQLYWEAGWPAPLPLPLRAKKDPPRGFTGADGVNPSRADIQAWLDDGHAGGNIALRLPPDVIGIDVDCYDGKQGAATLAELEAKWGPLPDTWVSSSRDDESGIRFYQVPPDRRWPSMAGTDIEIIQHRHRYAVVWPSIHPEGRPYRWSRFHLTAAFTVPQPSDLTFLPPRWIEGLSEGVGQPRTTGWTDPHLDELIEHGIPAGVLQDEVLRDVVWKLRGAEVSRLGARVIWAAIVAKTPLTRPSEPWTAHDFDRHWSGADAKMPPPLTVLEPPPAEPPGKPEIPEAEKESRFVLGGPFVLDAPDSVKAIWGKEGDVLWAYGESLIVAAGNGAGKTTLAGQLVRARLGLSTEVLGIRVEVGERRVLYLAMDRPQQIARSLHRHFKEGDRAILDDRLRVWRGPPPVDLAKNTETLWAMVKAADADTVVIDSLKDAAIGLSEDEVGAGWNRSRQLVIANGCQMLELHHNVKRNPSGGDPSTIADVYGSAWITAGVGSAILLIGAPGDPIVKMRHVKQPMNEVGPWDLRHDHDAGITDLFEHTDLLGWLQIVGSTTVTQAACHMQDTDKPDKNHKEKARRLLDKYERAGQITRISGTVNGADEYQIISLSTIGDR